MLTFTNEEIPLNRALFKVYYTVLDIQINSTQILLLRLICIKS